MGTTETTPESMKRQPTMAFVRRHYAQGPMAYYMDGSIVRMPTPADIEYAGQQFDQWLEAHDAEVARAAVVAAADDLAGHYPQDLFLPLTHADHEVVNAALMEHTGISRDRISADVMRRAASITRAYAEQIGEEI